MSDPEVIIFGFSWAPRVLFWLFLLSAFAQIDVIVVPMLIRSGAIHPFAIGSWSHVFGAAIEIVIVVGAGIFWLAMFYLFMRASRRGVFLWMLWMASFVFTNILGAQLYYLFAFRGQDRRTP